MGCGGGKLRTAGLPARCGRPPSGGLQPDRRAQADAENTLDAAADEHTIDLPTPAPRGATLPPSAPPPPASEVTQTMHFTPPGPPAGRTRADSMASVAESANRRPGEPPKTAPSAAAFAIIRQHARGGLGVVNLARDEFIKPRRWQLKQILPQHVDNAVLSRRFLYEAQITGQLEHPSIVPVYCLGTDEIGNPYYVMRFVKGRTLDEIIKEHHASPNPIVFRELLRRFIAVCQAVAYAHSRGVIHRDLKPANLMLGDYGETLVLDWGLAKDIKQAGNDPAALGQRAGESPSGRTGERSHRCIDGGLEHRGERREFRGIDDGGPNHRHTGVYGARAGRRPH